MLGAVFRGLRGESVWMERGLAEVSVLDGDFRFAAGLALRSHRGLLCRVEKEEVTLPAAIPDT